MYKDTDNISENKHFSDYYQYITAKIEPQFNKTCLKWGGNCLKKRVTAPVQAYFYLKSLAEFK